MDPKVLDDLARKLADAMPQGLRDLQQDMQRNVRAALDQAFSRMHLVTREEFEVQSAVLARTRAKVEQLEQQVAELEAQVLGGKSD
jgi:ubiquinone biosynthesis accessory factor UbiK